MGVRGTLSCAAAAGPKGPLASWAHCCPLQAAQERCSPRGVNGVGRSHSNAQAAFPGRQAGNGEEGAGETHGRMEADEDGGRSPFPGSPGPTETHPPSTKSEEASAPTPLPTCPAVPILQSPSPCLACTSARGGVPLSYIPPHPSEGQGSRAGTWAGSTDGMTRRAPVLRGHRGDRMIEPTLW